MIVALMSLLSKVNSLYTNYTSGRAANLDNLDATITSRASASDWTSARAAKLDTVALKTDPMLAPPIVLPTPANTNYGLTTFLSSGIGGFTRVTTTSTTFVDAINYTGSGVLEFLVFQREATATVYADLIIDGVTVASITNLGSAAWDIMVFVGTVNPVSAAVVALGLEPIPFYSSLQVRYHASTVNTVAAYHRYRKTS